MKRLSTTGKEESDRRGRSPWCLLSGSAVSPGWAAGVTQSSWSFGLSCSASSRQALKRARRAPAGSRPAAPPLHAAQPETHSRRKTVTQSGALPGGLRWSPPGPQPGRHSHRILGDVHESPLQPRWHLRLSMRCRNRSHFPEPQLPTNGVFTHHLGLLLCTVSDLILSLVKADLPTFHWPPSPLTQEGLVLVFRLLSF